MNTLSRRIWPIALAMFLAGATAARATVVNRIVATIDGEPVTQHELDGFTQKVTRGQVGPDQATLLEMLITDKLMQKEVTEKGIVVRDEDVDQYIQGIKERNHIDDAQLQQALTQQGMTLQTYRTQVRDEIQKAQLINREIRGKVNVTPEEVERYYQAHIDEFTTSEQMHLRHILVRVPDEASPADLSAATARADALYAQLKSGADFAELAQRASDDPGAKNGGDLGWVKSGEVLEPIEQAAEKMKPGQFSEPVRSPIGFHIVKLEERQGAGHVPLDQLAGGIKEQLYNAALEERYEKWLKEELRKRHAVEIRL